MMKFLLTVFALGVILLSGCSQKEINETSSEIGNDVSEFGEKIFKQR